MSAAKYERGEAFTDVHDLIWWIENGGCVYWNEFSTRALAPSFMVSQQYMTLKNVAKHGCRAVLKREAVGAR